MSVDLSMAILIHRSFAVVLNTCHVHDGPRLDLEWPVYGTHGKMIIVLAC